MSAPETRAARQSGPWLREQARPGRRLASGIVAFGLVGTLAAVGQAACVAGALAAALGRPTGWPVEGLVGGFAVLAALRAGLGVAGEGLSFALGAGARRRLRTEVLGRLLARGPVMQAGPSSGELTAVIVDRVDAIGTYFGGWLPASRLASAAPVVVALAAALADPVAALILAGCGLLAPLGMAFAGLGAAAASRRQFAAMARLQARFVDRIRGIGTIVLHGRAEDEARHLDEAGEELRARTMRVLRVAFLSSTALDLAQALALVVLALRFATRLAQGRGAPAAALFVLLLVPEFFASLRAFAAAYQERIQALTAADVLSALPEPPEAAPEAAIRTVAARGLTVAFEGVGLTWDPARGPALDGVNFRVASGEMLVLAGPSGAGKSSVIAILLGFVRPDCGRVTLNGADLASLVPQALARLTAWVGQRPMLFAASLRENIRLARPEATDAEVAEAVRAARLEGFVAGLPQGLDTAIGEDGFGLSGGQAQRVAVARAFLKDAPLLLLDEPTAHLDPATEAEVLDSLRRLAVGRTVILASHSAAAHAFAASGLGARRLDLRDGRVLPVRGAA